MIFYGKEYLKNLKYERNMQDLNEYPQNFPIWNICMQVTLHL